MGYKCFNTYFIGLNAHHKMQRGVAPSDSENTLDVLGIDALWRIAFEAPIDVSELATKELLRVYERFSEELGGNDEFVDASVKDFLHRAFQKLSEVADPSPASLKLVQQCSNLLSGLATNPRKKQRFTAHGMAGRGAYFNVKIIAQRIPTSSSSGGGGMGGPNVSPGGSHDNSIRTTQATVYANQTLWQFRKQLEKVVGHPLQQTKILSGGAAISGDQKTLAELNINETTELRVLMFNTVVMAYDQDQMVPPGIDAVPAHHPGSIIARNGSYFEILFRVLDIVEGNSVHNLLWEFLKKIPTATELLDQVSNIGIQENWDDDVVMDSPVGETNGTMNGTTEDWSSLLKTESQHKAVYTLQIMDALLLPADSTKIAFARSYLRRFIHGGGFHEVLSYFIKADFHASSFNEGAAVALRILKFCLFDSGHSDLYFSFAGASKADDGEYAVISPKADAEVTKSKIVIEQASYDNLVQKIAELVVSEYHRSERNVNSKTTPRILIDAIKTVESIVFIANDAADKYMSTVELQNLIATILMKSESDQVREQWLSTLQTVCKASKQASTLVFEKVIESVDRIELVTVSCDQYSRLLRFLAQAEGSSLICKALAQTVISKLRAGFSNKFLTCNERSVEVLIGYLEFLRDVLIYNVDARDELARGVVEVVYEECLFTLPSVDRKRGPLCVSLETRRPAFKLLATAISSNAEILHDLQTRLTRLFTKSDTLQFKWGQESNVETRGVGDHVGLKNQGCSCYMNSFLQQLFMHPTLRQGLMAAKVTPRPQPKEPTKAEVEKQPERLVGCRVAVECVGGRVYEANVVGYDDLSGRHTLRYDDGGEASFILAEGRQGNENGRYVILQSELTGTEATLEVLRQVQRTFSYLRDSEMRYFNPKALVDSCKCLNLEFSVYQQNDASEFCDKLLDRLETGLKSTPDGPKCLQAALGGKLISQKLPKDCGHRYEREEPFIRLELQIRGKESIEESLAGFVEGEVMDGDNKVECELCATKKAAVRRTCFGALPNLLILHLKRFDLDYTTFETVKLNNRCSFPMDLNMKPYTKAGIEELEASSGSLDDSIADEDAASEEGSVVSDDFMGEVNGKETSSVVPTSPSSSVKSIVSMSDGNENKLDPNFEYRLKGILVHSGVAQGGHYYSFIYDQESEKWFKFDDEDVSPFDPANIEAECFGGVQRRSWHGSSNAMEMEVFSNALMLFYEKVVLVANPDADDGSKAMEDTDEDARYEYEAEVWKSNEAFLQNSYLFDIEFHEFLREMVQSKYIKDQNVDPPSPSGSSLPAPPAAPAVLMETRSDETIQTTLTDVGVEFVLSVLLHSREKHGIARWITVLAAKFAKYKQICVRFFDALSSSRKIQWLRGLVFECPDSIARQSFVHLVSRALTAYDAHMKVSKDNSDVVVMRRFMETIAEFLDQTSVTQQSHLEECFMLIRNCAEISTTARESLQGIDMIARLVNFFLSDRAPSVIKEAFPSSHLPPAANRYASPDYQYLLEAIIAILGFPRRTTEPLLAETNSQYPHRVTLSEKAEEALTEIFEDFQVNGSLGIEELTKFLRNSVNSLGSALTSEQNARSIASKYGSREDPQRVELDGFLTYYTDIAAKSTKNVLQDLRAFGFGEDLKRQSRSLPLASTVLNGLSALSRGALLNDVFFDSALEEDAETVADLLLRISIGDHMTSAMLLRSLLHCMNSTETGWKGQPVIEVCTQVLQSLLSYEFDYQQELIEMALVNPEFGLITTAENREKIRQRYVNNNHVPLFVYRQIVIVLELQAKILQVKVWLDAHRREWEWTYEWLRVESLKPSLGGRLAVLFREPAKLETLHRLGEILNIPYREEERSYIVEGAGFEAVNGIYKSTPHTHDSCPTYACVKDDIEYTLFRCCMPSKARRWYITYSPNKNLLGTMSDEDYYFVQCHIDMESPPEEGWKVWSKNEKAIPPTPTVRLYYSTVDDTTGALPTADDDDFGDADDADVDCADVDADADADTVEYDDSEDEIRVSNERFQAVHLDNQEDGGSSSADDFM
uniref:USP domain-containing protein n=1 Tax=Globisporangium ultimum (strain ATCC 200006 / CBS 805.95 / DAOM BR144) TaxID=431595 RepID=K3X8D4_GLOUD